MLELKVNGMSCGHCVKAVTKAIQARDAGATVTIDLETKDVRVESVLPRETIAAAIEDAGYEAH